MTDYSNAADNAADALETSFEGMVEEYEISPRGRRVKRGKAKDQLAALAFASGLAARQQSGVFRVAKPKNPR